MTAPSNIRVAVKWANSTVFAGEDIECTITFTNIAAPSSPSRSPTRRPPNGSLRTPRAAPQAAVLAAERQKKLGSTTSQTTAGPVRPAPPSRAGSMASQSLPQQHAQVQLPSRGKGHRPSLSVSTATPATPRSAVTVGAGVPNSRHRHGRSLSIISIGTNATTDASRGKSGKPRGHGRSASMQVMPRSAMGKSRPDQRSGTIDVRGV
jgi:RAB6A-GEF complex partner protein 2